MGQHFLLSAKARTLTLRDIYRDGEDKAYKTFCEMRWQETEGKPVCPRCGCLDIYSITTRRKFKCAACSHQFSVTSGTIFASRKMAFTDMLGAVCIFVNAVKGLSALQLARDLDCQYKTAFVLAHKLRESLAAETANVKLTGRVEVDGAVFGGHVRPENVASERIDRRLAEHQTGKRRVVVAIRQRKGRTLTFVVNHEADGVYHVHQRVAIDAEVHADEAPHWDVLHARFNALRINHKEAYSLNGICSNLAVC
jgi:transposase-like protein